jgi:beta-glucosidase/6-phospho-beta-glucosidase/beta-galactosidase
MANPIAAIVPAGSGDLPPSQLEVWGGVEYTCNRVEDRYFNQMDLSGHAERVDDYVRFLGLGIRTLRMGVLWEQHERDASWRRFDSHLSCVRRLGIRPIASLVHHGSGPQHTSLIDPAFPQKLAGYAASVAERYPWIDSYTPVNEPNTTARFSGMYGVWYPHHRSRFSYVRALINQLKGTVLSMEAIRRVRSDARLIQTDDVGSISGTAALDDTWTLMNLRQWLPYDLLCGKVDRHHPMFAYLLASGICESEINWFAEHPCPPNVIGVNYYVTSDRFLDHRVEEYPESRRSAEGPYVDLEAVRACASGIVGVESLLERAWQRYNIPVAITEVHLGSTPDEQIRWLAESWEGAMRARCNGVNCVALTVWALLGSFFWNELVTRENGHYEPGVFDLRSGSPVATQLASIVAQIARGKTPRHEALSQAGWWRRPDRICFSTEDVAA